MGWKLWSEVAMATPSTERMWRILTVSWELFEVEPSFWTHCWMAEVQATTHIHTGVDGGWGLGLLWEPAERSGDLKMKTKLLSIVMSGIKAANFSLTCVAVCYVHKLVRPERHPDCHYMTMSMWKRIKRKISRNYKMAPNQISDLKIPEQRLYST